MLNKDKHLHAIIIILFKSRTTAIKHNAMKTKTKVEKKGCSGRDKKGEHYYIELIFFPLCG